jgi:predicted DNA-binding transcriptional regulator YafY
MADHNVEGHFYEIVRWILGWGPDVEVLEPQEVRMEVRHRLDAAVRSYDQHGAKP